MLRMNSVRKKRTDKTVVKEHIVLAAAKSFAQKGVKTVRMDDIAAGLSISKRTLYELFHDKEDLLLDVMKLHREEMQEYMTQVASKAENVLEVLLKFFQRSAQEFQNTNRKFFEDIEKYPKECVTLMKAGRRIWIRLWNFIAKEWNKAFLEMM